MAVAEAAHEWFLVSARQIYKYQTNQNKYVQDPALVVRFLPTPLTD
jgi:hypothetical protein